MGYLQIIHGQGSIQRAELSGPEIILGRSTDAHVVLRDANVSRRHARILFSSNQWQLEDLGSRNGTFLNDKPATKGSRLKSGDVIRIGPFRLEFNADQDPSPDPMVTIHHQTAAHASNTELFSRNSAAKLQAIIQLSTALSGSLERPIIIKRFLEHLLAVFPLADRALILVDRNSTVTVEQIQERSATRRSANAPLFSRTLFNQVIDSGVGILADEVDHTDPKLSLHALGVRSLVCAPLRSQAGQILGVVQMDRSDPSRKLERDDLDLLTAMALQVATILENVQLHHEQISLERVRRDLMLAREIQLGFLPSSIPFPDNSTLELHAELDPAHEISGDFYDYFEVSDRRLAALVADVAGKGMPAALFMSMVRSLLRQLACQYEDPADILMTLNDLLARDNPKALFVTIAIAIYDISEHTCRICRAGHPPPLLISASGTIKTTCTSTGFLLGIEAPCPRLYSAELKLDPGDSIIFYTDGITEAPAAKTHRMFGQHGIEKSLARCPPEASLPSWAAQLRTDVDAHCGGAQPEDDLTLLMIRRRT